MQLFAGLITFLKKYRVELTDGMATEVEFQACNRNSISTQGIHLKLIPREGWEKRVFKEMML